MSKTLGPILAIGAITVVNQNVIHQERFDWRVPIATGLAGIGFSMVERVWSEGAVILAYTALATVILTRTKPDVPAPSESIINWFDSIDKKGMST